MDLSTTYLGLKLRTPLVPSASPLSEEIDNIKRMEDAGASAIVLYSLFEEQLRRDLFEIHHHYEQTSFTSPEALTYFPEPVDLKPGPDHYLKQIARAKEAVNVPIIGSLNGSTVGGWTEYARGMQEAGADAIELNIYQVPTDPDLTAADMEETCLEILRTVKEQVSIPVAVKVSPFFTNFAHMAKKLDLSGADGMVLFNRFYQPDIDLEHLEVRPNVLLSTPMAMRLPLRWIAILYGRIRSSIAATSGIHRASDALKMLMAGADVTMLCSVLLRHGIDQLSAIERDLVAWMEEHEYESITQLKGSLSQKNCPDPSGFERAQYLRSLTTFPLQTH